MSIYVKQKSGQQNIHIYQQILNHMNSRTTEIQTGNYEKRLKLTPKNNTI